MNIPTKYIHPSIPHDQLDTAPTYMLERAARYVNNGTYGQINSRLRKGLDLNHEDQKILRAFKYLARPSTGQVVLYRGLLIHPEKLPDTWTDPALVSASMCPNVAQSFARRGKHMDPETESILLELHIPAGIKMLNIAALLHWGDLDLEGYSSEREVILEPNLNYEANDFIEHIDHSHWIVDVTK